MFKLAVVVALCVAVSAVSLIKTPFFFYQIINDGMKFEKFCLSVLMDPMDHQEQEDHPHLHQVLFLIYLYWPNLIIFARLAFKGGANAGGGASMDTPVGGASIGASGGASRV